MKDTALYTNLLTAISSSSSLHNLSLAEAKAKLESYYADLKNDICGTEYAINDVFYDNPLDGLVKENEGFVDYDETERRLSSYSEKQFKKLKKSIKARLYYELGDSLMSMYCTCLKPVGISGSHSIQQELSYLPLMSEGSPDSQRTRISQEPQVNPSSLEIKGKRFRVDLVGQIEEAERQDYSQLTVLYSQLDNFKYECAAYGYCDDSDMKKIIEIEKLKINLMRCVNDLYMGIKEKDRQRRYGNSAYVITELHFNRRYNENQLKSIYDYLVDNNYIEPLLFEEFSYYFSGKGNAPFCNIKWNKSAALLSIFITSLFSGKTKADTEPEMWKKAEAIFKKKNLAQSYQQAISRKDYYETVQMFSNIIR